jgi:hypothetical protein
VRAVDPRRTHSTAPPAGGGPPARPLKLQARELRGHGARRHAERLQRIGAQRHQHFAVDAAGARHLADARDAEQRLGDHVVDEPRQFVRGEPVGLDGVRDQGAADQVEALDQRLLDVVRQVGARLADGVADLVQRLVDVAPELELDARDRRALADRGDDLVDAGEARDRVLDAPRDVGLELRGGGAGQVDRDLDGRQRDVRQRGDRQLAKAVQAGDAQHRERQARGQRMTDAPQRQVHVSLLRRP